MSFCQKFSYLSETKIKTGISDEPQIIELMADGRNEQYVYKLLLNQ